MLEVKSVCKTFGELKAVDEISFSTQPGQILGLIGPNGAGKSTIIRMIMGILAPDRGEILFDGNRLKENDKERIGYLPEERGLYKKIKVREMLHYLATLKGMAAAAARENIDRWLGEFGLADWAERKIEELSKGMSQKVQFISAIAHDPDLIFFDEPFSGLDPVSTDLMRETILEMGRQRKLILFSTHQMDSAEKICTHIFMINRGRKVLGGSLREIKDSYGEKSVLLEFDGDGGFISGLPEVEKVLRYPRYVEIALAENARPEELLKYLAGRLSIRRFEISSPSLHTIFVEHAGQPASERAGPLNSAVQSHSPEEPA